MHRPRSILTMIIAAGVMSLAACGDLTVPDYNNGQLDDLQDNPTPTAIRQAVQGMVFGARSYAGAQNGYVSLLGILGRESYNFDPADTRFITEMLVGPLDPGSPAFGANLWNLRYANIRLGNEVLAAVGGVALLSDGEKEGVRAVVKTIQAHDFLMVLNTRDDLGAPIDVPVDPVAAPGAIATKAQVQAHIVQLLNEAQTHLGAANVSFPFSLGSGFAGFDTPATFLQFNRALKARVDVYMGNYADALTSLAGSFLSTSASLDLGAYHVHSTRSGDTDNQIFDPTGRAILAHPSIVTDAQLQPGGAADARVGRKIAQLPATRTVQGVSTDYRFTIYTSPDAAIPIIRNEELILLRAEANIGINTPASLTAALADINLIRTTSGGLAPAAAFATQAAARTELLYNKRYSLLFEGGHRWIDLRRYGLLNTLPLAVTGPVGTGHTRPSRFPFPEAECLARSTPPTGCTPQAGI